jgi:DNA-binding beta-propeller fold protein YncE
LIGSQIQRQRRVLSPTLTHSVSIQDGGVSAIAAFDNMLFIARGHESDKVEVYDASTLQQLRQISIPSCYSSGLASCSTNNCLYVSDRSNYKIHKVSLSTYTVTTSWSTVATRPRGLSVNRSHNLLVCEWYEYFHEYEYENTTKKKKYTKTIAEYSTTGSRVREISTDDDWLCQAIELNDGTLAVTRTGPVHGVCVMSVDGKVVRSYGSSSAGSGPGQMNYPCGLAIDKQGFIVVADSGNNRIIVLNPTLTDSSVLPLPVSPGFTSMCGLWYDESRGRLYVGECSDNGRLLVFDNVFNLSTIFS